MNLSLSSCLKCALVLLIVVQYGESVRDNRRLGRVRYEHFEDYLVGALTPNSGSSRGRRPTTPSRRRQSRPSRFGPTPAETDDEDLSETGSGQRSTNGNPPPTTADLLEYFRDVPREHWSCCMLGKLAGNKGFHCLAPLYAARINRRNGNRAHNRRTPLHGLRRILNYGRELMTTFRRCVVNRRAQEFHKCCYAATIETREMSRWQQRYRHESLENEATEE